MINRTFDLLDVLKNKFPKEDALASKVNGAWKKISTQEYINNVNDISAGLLALGIKKGDNIASITNNRFEWNFIDMGMAQIGAVHVPIYPTVSENDLAFILEDADVKLVFVSSTELFEKVSRLLIGIKHHVSCVYTFNEVAGAKHWATMKVNSTEKTDEINKIKSQILPQDLLTILYTSGTTGNPKGVMISHLNLMSNVDACKDLAPFANNWRALSFLPINHVYERMLVYLYQLFGISIYYAESIETIGDNLKEIKPMMFVTVPRLLEKVYDKIVAKGQEQTRIKKMLFFWALDLGLKYEVDGKNGWWYEFKLAIANKIIFSKWREALGGNVLTICSGGAALQPRLARVFNAAKILVLEGYGLTETAVVVAVNSFKPDGIHFGSVGKVISNVQVKFGEDGEILVKGPNVMLGYYKRPDLTAEVIDSDGYFHTGDIGIMEEGKYLKITDRKKEIFKTSGGKYIAPQMIENKLKESQFIEQVIVIGENQKFPSAIIVPAFIFLREYCIRKNIPAKTNEEIISNKEIIARIQEEVQAVNQHLAQYEQVKRYELLASDWTIEKGELTPKLSLRRKAIMEHYKSVVDKIYCA